VITPPPSVLARAATSGVISEADLTALAREALEPLARTGKRVLVIIPDATRTFPMPLYFRLVNEALHGRAAAVDYLIALGTHAPMSEAEIDKLVGLPRAERERRWPGVRVFNHAWDDPGALTQLGTISADEIDRLSEGRLRVDVPVRLNKLVLDYDDLLVCGPVFPHEVVGFSGGNKYFFPGIAGADIINLTHWIGALVTSYDIIGVKETPVRRVIDRAAALIPRPRHALCSVVTHEGVAGAFFGTPESAYAAAAELSAQRHVIWIDRPYRQVLSVLPAMYDEMWVGAKGMYKTDPGIADGGEVIIYAPHVHEVSRVHGKTIAKIGYHVRDYFVKQWDRFKDVPWGLLAHSTHLKGSGTYEGGVERPRIEVTLATGIPEAECRALNLGYRDPATIDPKSFAGREAEGVLLVPKAGEYLYRVRAGKTAAG
jgi:lactate racemase